MSVGKAGLTIYEFVTWDTGNCPWSVLTGVRIKWVSVERDSTVC